MITHSINAVMTTLTVYKMHNLSSKSTLLKHSNKRHIFNSKKEISKIVRRQMIVRLKVLYSFGRQLL